MDNDTDAEVRVIGVVRDGRLTPQVQLLQMAMLLKTGYAITISSKLIRDAARDELTGLDRMGGARQEDVDRFINKIQKNWGVQLNHDWINDCWSMFRPEQRPRN